MAIPANDTRYAVGMNFAGAGLSGFELSDLTIDCNLAGNSNSGVTAGAVRVQGKHVFVHRVKVIGYGSKSSSTTFGVITAAGDASENCVIEECAMDPAGSGHVGIALLYNFEGSAAHVHRFCAIRNCAALGLLYNDTPTFDIPPPIQYDRVRAIAPGTGVGTILEGNQIANCSVGVYGDGLPKDVVVWNNYFRNVSMGMWFKNNTASSVGRLVLIENFIELATVSGSLSGETSTNSQAYWQTAISLNTTQTSGTRFDQSVIRKNIIRDVQLPPGVTANLRGARVQRCAELIGENNIINNIAESLALYSENGTTRKFFNNQDQAGKLLRGYNGTQKVLELEDAVQDVLLPL